MSHQAVRAVLATTGSRGNARCVLIALAYHANDDGACWPSVETIAAEANVSPRTAQAMLAALAEAGEIVIERNAGPRRTNLYRVTCCTPQSLHGAACCTPAACCTMLQSETVQHVAPPQIAAPKESYSDSFANAQESDATFANAQVAFPGPPPAVEGAATKRPPRPRRERAHRERDALFDAYCRAFGVDPDRPGNKSGLAGDFSARCRKAGVGIGDFREYFRRSKAAGEWGKFDLPHNVTDRFLGSVSPADALDAAMTLDDVVYLPGGARRPLLDAMVRLGIDHLTPHDQLPAELQALYADEIAAQRALRDSLRTPREEAARVG